MLTEKQVEDVITVAQKMVDMFTMNEGGGIPIYALAVDPVTRRFATAFRIILEGGHIGEGDTFMTAEGEPYDGSF